MPKYDRLVGAACYRAGTIILINWVPQNTNNTEIVSTVVLGSFAMPMALQGPPHC